MENTMKDHRLRAEELCGRMNLDEKIAQLHSIWLIWTNHGNPEVKTLGGLRHGRSSEDPYRLMAHGIGQITRPLGTAPIDAAEGVRQLNQVQEFLVKRTRMGIPAIAHEECLAGVMARGATLFPSGLNMGSLWDEQLVREIGAAIGTELESTGARQGSHGAGCGKGCPMGTNRRVLRRRSISGGKSRNRLRRWSSGT